MKFSILSCITLLFFSVPTLAEWQIKQEDLKTFEKFAKTDEVQLYTGDNILHDFENLPSKGHQFVLVRISATNQDTKINPLNSLEFTLKINGKTYSRIKEDGFLLDYSIRPFTKLKIRKGSHTGHLLFEIPTDELTKTPTLYYMDQKIQ